jgi:hypothetical protein
MPLAIASVPLLGALTALVTASPAAAIPERFAPVHGPVLAGDGLAWTHEQGGGERVSVRFGSSGSSRELFEISGARRHSFVRAWLSASDSHLAVEVTDRVSLGDPTGTNPMYWSRSVVGGPVNGPFGPLAEPCTERFGDDDERWRGVAVSGSRVAFAGPGCGPRSVHDAVSGERFGLPEQADDLRVDGDWVAWRENVYPSGEQQVVVHNMRTAQAYRVPARGGVPVPRDFDVDGSGRLVVLPARSDRSRLLWASPAQPVLRKVPLGRPRVITRVRIEDGIVAALARDTGERYWSLSGYVLAGDPARGALRRYGAGLDAGTIVGGAFDFDGTSVAALVRRCDGVRLLRADRLESLRRFEAPRRCSLKLLGRPRLEYGRSLRLSFSCAGYVPRCDADRLRAVTPGRPARLVGRASYINSAVRARLWLTGLGRRLARRGALRRVRVSARLSDNFGIWRGRPHTVIARVASTAGSG